MMNVVFRRCLTSFAAFVFAVSLSVSAFADVLIPEGDSSNVPECVTSEGPRPVVSDEVERQVSAPVWGDVNGDNAFNAADFVLAAAHVKGIRSLENRFSADVNGDGAVNVKDLVMLAAALKGNYPFR